jgi:hypothetical protein
VKEKSGNFYENARNFHEGSLTVARRDSQVSQSSWVVGDPEIQTRREYLRQNPDRRAKNNTPTGVCPPIARDVVEKPKHHGVGPDILSQIAVTVLFE